MTTPLYYIHSAAQGTEAWQAAARYRITGTKAVRILGYYRDGMTEDQLVQEMLGERSPKASNDAMLWGTAHEPDARAAHALFQPAVTRLSVGLVVNAAQPWLAHSPDDFTWGPKGLGLNEYKCPYSLRIPSDPNPAHEIQMTHGVAVTEWTRPMVDYLIWTPSKSSLRHYHPDALLTQEITMRQLWDGFIYPRVEHFYRSFLVPALEVRGIDVAQLYAPTPSQYVAVSDPQISVAELTAAFANA